MTAVGILALDPGTTSGVDVGFWDVGVSVADAVASYRGETYELKLGAGGITQMAGTIQLLWEELIADAVRLKVEHCYMAIEDYIQRPSVHVVERSALDPVRVAWCLLGRLDAPGDGAGVIWQTPSDAMSYATNERLRSWGAWVKGSDHKRDARRHALLARNRLAGLADGRG